VGFASAIQKKDPCSADFACTGGAKWDKTASRWDLVGNQIEFRLIPTFFKALQVFMVKVWPSV
jgi:hypothetical protein